MQFILTTLTDRLQAGGLIMTAKDFIIASDAALDLRGPAKDSFTNHFFGMLQCGVMARPQVTTADLVRMVDSSVKYAKSQHNEN